MDEWRAVDPLVQVFRWESDYCTRVVAENRQAPWIHCNRVAKYVAVGTNQGGMIGSLCIAHAAELRAKRPEWIASISSR
jgi:hypothetical protein